MFVCVKCNTMFDGILTICPDCLSKMIECTQCGELIDKGKKYCDACIAEGLKNFADKFITGQVSMPPEFLKVLNDNFEDLLA